MKKWKTKKGTEYRNDTNKRFRCYAPFELGSINCYKYYATLLLRLLSSHVSLILWTVACCLTTAAWCQCGKTSFAMLKARINCWKSTPKSCFVSVKYESKFSVAMLPVKSSFAIGQPPKPFIAASNLTQPFEKAACTFSRQLFGCVCRCAPISRFG